jgi:glycosyltransferase involved in cell wall biosynthesis
MTSAPLVSIIVPSFNQGRFIRETIDSILSQDYRPIEVLVFDGGSTDETVSVLESYAGAPEVQWWSAPDKGVVDAVNKGFANATGEILAIQSSDDVYVPGAIRAAVEAFTGKAALGLVYGDVEYIDEGSQCTGRTELPPFQVASYVGKLSYIPQAAAFFRHGLVAEIGGWREDISYAADAEFWLRIALRKQVLKLDRIIAKYRYHEGQRDAQGTRVARAWERAMTEFLAGGGISRRLKRFARMGIYLTWHHYTPEEKWWDRTRFLYRAAWANPAAVFTSDFPKRELLPGREPIWKMLSMVKRRLGLKPRTA